MKRLLILEEALRDRNGHWFEYSRATKAAIQSLGSVSVTILGNVTMEQSVADEIDAKPHFRYTVWDQIYVHPNAWRRYFGILLHNIRIYSDVSRFLRDAKRFDTIFAPTVVLHHLLAFHRIAKRYGGLKFEQIILLVRNNVAVYDQDGHRKFRSTAKIWRWAIKRFKPMIANGRVRFVTDSDRIADEYEELTGIRFEVIPHPSLIGAESDSRDELMDATLKTRADMQNRKKVRIFLPGPARYEKGSDRLMDALKLLDKQSNFPPVEFVLQWMDSYRLPCGKLVGPEDILGLQTSMKRIDLDLIQQPLSSQEYRQQMLDADIIMLPYRRETYFARISGVAVEAMMLGKPILYTSNTWVESIAMLFGLGSPMENSVSGVVDGVSKALGNLNAIKLAAENEKVRISEFFSAKRFAKLLLSSNVNISQ